LADEKHSTVKGKESEITAKLIGGREKLKRKTRPTRMETKFRTPIDNHGEINDLIPKGWKPIPKKKGTCAFRKYGRQRRVTCSLSVRAGRTLKSLDEEMPLR